MAVTGYTSDDLLSRVKARAQMPAADDRLSDAEILAMADDAIRSTVGRIIWNADDGRWVETYADVTISASVSDYRLPDRAIGEAVYDVLYVDADGDEHTLPYVDSADAWRWRSDAAPGADGGQYRFTIEGDTLRLLPTPSVTAGSLRIKYRRRPSRLVLLASCGALTAQPDDGDTAASVSAIPSVATGISEGGPADFDLVRAAPGGAPLEDDIRCTWSGTTVTRSSGGWPTTGPNALLYSLPSGYADYLCPVGKTCVVPVPAEAVPFLTALVALEVLTVLGDMAAVQSAAQIVAGRRRELVALVDDRSREDEAIIPRSSHLRAGRRWTRRGIG